MLVTNLFVLVMDECAKDGPKKLFVMLVWVSQHFDSFFLILLRQTHKIIARMLVCLMVNLTIDLICSKS